MHAKVKRPHNAAFFIVEIARCVQSKSWKRTSLLFIRSKIGIVKTIIAEGKYLHPLYPMIVNLKSSQ